MATRSSQVTSQLIGDNEYAARSLGYVWDPIALDYVVATPATGGGGGGGGAVTIADGADVAQGATADPAAVVGDGTVIGLLKRLRDQFANGLFVSGGELTALIAGTTIAAGAPYDLPDRVQFPAALSGAGNLTVSIAEDGGAVISVDDNGASLTTDTPQLPAALVGGRVDVNVGASTMLPTKEVRAGTSALSNVAASVASVTVLAANANRLGATIWNDSTSVLYLKLGAVASATSCTVKLIADAYYELPFGYTGIITGIWVAAAGSARVTEISA